MKLPGLVIMCLIHSGFLVYVMVVASQTVYLISAVLTLFTIGWYIFIKFCQSKMWFEFNIGPLEKIQLAQGVLGSELYEANSFVGPLERQWNMNFEVHSRSEEVYG
ncbi:hypothetical protein RJ641_007515 [Dillenia turbinata]|uniref:Uncharacterized protein n=1 Tax=Dillenia turbinata TaxID=194707 RepID=A0AAN8V8X9_9MAGN